MPDVTAATFPVTIGDKQYHMSPLSDKDIEELNNMFRADMIRAAQASLTEDMSEAERREVLSAAMREAQQFTWYGDADESRRVMKQIPSIARIVWMSVRRASPDARLEDIQKALFDPNNLDATMTVWKQLNVGSGGTPKGKARRPVKRSRRSKSTQG